MRMFITEESEGKKCGGCNWETNTFYGVGKNFEDAKARFSECDNEYGKGICSGCMCDFLAKEKAEIEGVE